VNPDTTDAQTEKLPGEARSPTTRAEDHRAETDRAETHRPTVWLPIGSRYIVYSLAIGLLFAGLMALAAIESTEGSFEEGSPIEWLQTLCLLTTAALLASAAWRYDRRDGLCGVLTLTAMIGAIREMDYLLDIWLPIVGWKGPAILLALRGIWVMVWRWDPSTWKRLERYAAHASFAILWMGFLIIVIVAQIVGQGEIWRTVMGENYVYSYKRTFEELVETLGYATLLIGAVETRIAIRNGEI